MQWPCNDKAPEGTPVMHIGGFVRGKGKFMITEFIPTDERTTGRFPLILTTGRILSQYNVGAQTRAHAEQRLARYGRARDSSVRRRESRHQGRRPRFAYQPRGRYHAAARISERMQPGVVYTTFHHAMTGANVVTTDFSDWATNCPEYKVTAVQVQLAQAYLPVAGALPRDAPHDDANRKRDSGQRLAMEPEHMVHMANQIALFFASYPKEEAVAGVTDHFQKYLGAAHAQADHRIRGATAAAACTSLHSKL